jgi:hypothetical protein
MCFEGKRRLYLEIIAILSGLISAGESTAYIVPGDTLPPAIVSNTAIYVRGDFAPPSTPWVIGPSDQSGSNIRVYVGDTIPHPWGPPFPSTSVVGHLSGDLVANSGVAISTSTVNSSITGDVQLLGNATLMAAATSSVITGDITAGGNSIVSGGRGTIRGNILASDSSVINTGEGDIEGDIALNGAAKFRMDHMFANYSGNIVANGPNATVDLINGGAIGSLQLLNGAVLRAGQSGRLGGVVTADASTILLQDDFGSGFAASEIHLNNGSFLDTGMGFFTNLRAVVHINQDSRMVVGSRFEYPGTFYPETPSIYVNDGGLLQVVSGVGPSGAVVVESGGRAEVSGSSAAFEVRSNAEVSITGGSHMVTVRDSALVTATTGFNGYIVDPGADVQIFGGAFRQRNTLGAGYGATLVGDDFTIGGVPVSGLVAPGDKMTIDLPAGVEVRGVLSDGTPFLLSPVRNDNLQSLTLELAPLTAPPVGSPLLASQTPGLVGLRSGQSIEVDAGGSLRSNFRSADQTSVVVKTSGFVNSGYESYGGNLVVTGGELKGTAYLYGGQFEMNAGKAATVNYHSGVGATLSAGVIENFQAIASPWTQTGGTVTTLKTLDSPSVSIGGGSVAMLEARASNVVVDGGVVTSSLSIDADSTLSWGGAEFWLNGAPVDLLGAPGDTVTIPYDSSLDVLSGVQADGTPFIFDKGGQMSVQAPAITLTRRSVAPPTATNLVYQGSAANSPKYIREGQTLTVTEGGTLGSVFRALGGSTLIVERGAEVDAMYAAGATIEVFGEAYVHALNGSNVRVHSGGELDFNSEFHPNSRLTIESGGVANVVAFHEMSQVVVGGILGRRDPAANPVPFKEGSRLEITTTGLVGDTLDFAPGAVAEIRGGLSTTITTSTTTAVKIYGDDFSIGGVPIAFDATGKHLLADVPAGATLLGVSEGGGLVIADRHSSIASGSVELIRTTPVYGEPGDYEVPATPDAATEYTPWAGSNTVHHEQTLHIRNGASLPLVDVGPGGHVVVGNGGTIGAYGGRVVGGILEFQAGAVLGGDYAAYSGGVIKMVGANGSATAGSGGVVIIDSPGLTIFRLDGGLVEILSGTGRIVRDGQGEVVLSGGSLNQPYYTAERDFTDLTLTITGGSYSGNNDFLDSTIRAVAGNAGSPILYSSELDISGNASASNPTLRAESRFRQSGNSTVQSVTASAGAEAYFSGGTIKNHTFSAGSEMHLYATEFLIDGTPIEELQLGEQTAIIDRDVTITAIWQNGGQQNFVTSKGISADALLTVTLVGAPGDYNYDGVVNTADYTVWRDAFDLGESYADYHQADGDFNGVVDDRDRGVWAAHYGSSSLPANVSTVPEPGAAGLLALAALLSQATGSRRCFQA